jgi:D-aminopeptidase
VWRRLFLFFAEWYYDKKDHNTDGSYPEFQVFNGGKAMMSKRSPILRFGIFFFAIFLLSSAVSAQRPRARELGIEVGIFQPGALNAITDVAGVKVGHRTIIRGDNIRTGVTAVLPHGGNVFQEKVPAAIYVGNGFGKLAGSTQVMELGNIETPIILTNTLSIGTAVRAVVSYTLSLPGNEDVMSVNAVAAETNDGFLNDIRAMVVTETDVIEAIRSAKSGMVEEGSTGAGTGTVCFGFKGGIGTASRKLPSELGGWTVGVLVQTNFGGILTVNGAPVGRELGVFPFSEYVQKPKVTGDGSCIVVVATDAPLCARNLQRLAKRTMLGLARTGSFMSNGSGDYAIAFSTAYKIPHGAKGTVPVPPLVTNDLMSPLFLATVEATEEAVLNSLFTAETMTGFQGRTVESLPMEKILEILKLYNAQKNDVK